MKIFFYVIKGLENMTFDSLSEARRAYWEILEEDGMNARKLRGMAGKIIRKSWATGKTIEFGVR